MKLTGFIKKINHEKVLAVIFTVIIFYVGAAALPSKISVLTAFIKYENAGIFLVRDKADEEYRDMLKFTDGLLSDKAAYINFNGLLARIMGQRGMNNIVKLDNGYLASLVEEKDTSLAAKQLTKLYNRQKENGKEFLFVLAPSKIPEDEDILPAGYTDYSNQNSGQLLEALRNDNVPVLDLREELRNDGISYSEAFYKTDHHWKAQTGFWAYTKIIDYFVKTGIIEPVDSKYTDINEFNVEIYENWFLGSSGKRTGNLYAGVDDFAVITPKFETYLSFGVPAREIYKQGDFAQVAYQWELIKQGYFTANPYAAYGHADNDYTWYRNESAPCDLKILSFGDSFNNVPFTLLPLVMRTCDELDLRFYRDNFEEYYSEFDPDIVIVLVGAGTPAQANTTYNFFDDDDYPEQSE